MQFDLVDMGTLVAETELRNDATEMYFDLKMVDRAFELQFKEDSISLFYSRKGKIAAGEKYIRYDFVEIETGEMMAMNCSFRMDRLNRRNNVYPYYILNAIKNYEINNLI